MFQVQRNKTIHLYKLGLILILFLCLILNGCSSQDDISGDSEKPFSETRYDLLGTVITISLYDHPDDQTIQKSFREIEEIENRMSLKKPSSEINQVAEMAGVAPVKVSEDTFYVIQQAKTISELSDGAFELSIGPLVSLWGIGTDSQQVPRPEDIAKAQELIDYRQVILNETDQTVYLEKAGMCVDLGAIAKGYAGDRVKEVLKKAGVRNAIADLGGNIVTIGARPSGDPWRVAIKNPILGESGNVGVVQVSDKAVVTSGGYERFFTENDQVYHHILDAKTGYPADSDLLSVTIVSESSTIGDMLSTPVFMLGMGPKSMELLDHFGAEAIFITKQKQVYVTDGLADHFTLLDSAFSQD